MKYPKPRMKISELEELGYKRDYLLSIAKSRGINRTYKIASRLNEGKKNSPFYFDTEALEKYERDKCNGR